ncbi:enoyl-CoA delta isomerase 1, mitochondrial [Trichonephila clavipes]|nr:enoyl-CoA delta isomerase 1, mitochondrial [Trichonephila clavipes]
MVKSGGFIGLNETLLGVSPPKWVYSVLVNACGIHKAEHALKTGKLFTPQEALEYDIVNELVDSLDLLLKAEEALNMWLTIPDLARALHFQVQFLVFSFTKTKLSMRKPFVDDLISYQEQDLKNAFGMIFQKETQKIIAKYVEGLKDKNK